MTQTPPVYNDTRIRLLATSLAVQHIEQGILIPCFKTQFVRLVLAVLTKMSSDYERKLRAMQSDLDMATNLNRAYYAQTTELRGRITELEMTLAEVPAEAWKEMADVHL